MAKSAFDRELDEWMDDEETLSARASASLSNLLFVEALKRAGFTERRREEVRAR